MRSNDSMSEVAQTRVVVAVHSRDVKTALFLALNAIPSIEIVATATSTAEVDSYCRAFRPDIVIVESDLPGRPMFELLEDFEDSTTPREALVIGDDAERLVKGKDKASALRDIDHLATVLPGIELEKGTS
jgi:DNA-binding NarL/FixJ family response regulator